MPARKNQPPPDLRTVGRNKRSALRQSGAKAYGLDSDFGERI